MSSGGAFPPAAFDYLMVLFGVISFPRPFNPVGIAVSPLLVPVLVSQVERFPLWPASESFV